MTEMLAILAVGIGTYFTRSVFIVALANRRIPVAVLSALDFVAPSVMAALVVSLLIGSDGRLEVGAAQIAAFVVGGATVFRSRNLLLAAVLGMAAFWGVGALI
jgi:branched-subunit amino acid transport protein